jgi:hypothetical protein
MAGQVVVDERVGVDELERGGERHHVLRGAADRAGGGEREDGADPLAACQERVAHRLLEARGGGRGEKRRPRGSLDALAQVVGVGPWLSASGS